MYLSKSHPSSDTHFRPHVLISDATIPLCAYCQFLYCSLGWQYFNEGDLSRPPTGGQQLPPLDLTGSTEVSGTVMSPPHLLWDGQCAGSRGVRGCTFNET